MTTVAAVECQAKEVHYWSTVKSLQHLPLSISFFIFLFFLRFFNTSPPYCLCPSTKPLPKMDTESISRVRSSVWYLQVFDTNGSSTTGGAVCINKCGLLITAASVIKNAQVIYARPWEGKKRKVKMVAAVYEHYGVALLWLERSRSSSSSSESCSWVDLKRDAEVGVGEVVCTFTHQARKPFTFSTGTISSLTSFPLIGEPLPSDLPLHEAHYLNVTFDSFGSPLFSVITGDLVGIVVLERGSCNYVVPSYLLYHCVLQALQAPPQDVVRPSHVDNSNDLFRSDFTITSGQPPQL